jgi:hypothetical protein
MGKEKLKANYRRVYEIYGIDPRDHSYNIHHIIMKREVKSGLMKNFDVNKISNLIPLLKEDHAKLHKRIDLMEHYHGGTAKKKKKRRKR